MNAISGRRAPTITPPARSSSLRRAEVGRELAGVDPPLELLRPAAPEERRPAPRRQLAVEEDRQPELRPDPARQRQRRLAGVLQVVTPDRHDRNDVRGADPRMRAFVPAQVDPLARAGDAGQQRLDERIRARPRA